MKIRPDVLVVWPRTCDFPKWRAQMNARRDDFGKIICVFSDNILPAKPNYQDWLRGNFEAEWVETPEHGDWYSKCHNAGLEHSDAEWVLFTEPDCFFERFEFAQIIRKEQPVGVREHGGRWHPCFFLARREDVDKTDRNFAVTEWGDAFTHFGNQMDAVVAPDKIIDVGSVDGWLTHMQGLTESHTHVTHGREPTFKPEQFKAYLRECLDCGESLPEEWEAAARRWLG